MKCAFILCGKEFTPHKPNQIFCCEDCRKKSHLKQYTTKSVADMTYTCSYCGKEFIAERKRKFCTPMCRHVAYGRYSRRNIKEIKPKKSEKVIPPESLADINAKAAALGLSYGQYMQKQYFEKVVNNREI